MYKVVYLDSVEKGLAGIDKPRTTPSQAWPWGKTLRENRAHPSPSSQPGLCVLRGKSIAKKILVRIEKYLALNPKELGKP